MSERLREIAELTAAFIQFLREQAQMVGSTHALAHHKTRLVEPTGRARHSTYQNVQVVKAPLASFKPVVVSVPVNHAVVAEEFADCVERL
jgi:hypothetical protein